MEIQNEDDRSAPMTLTLFLMGPVRLVCSLRGDITPRGQKARGALALLGTAHGLRMSRSKLQDKLWSESRADQGAASLRQVLRELRIALGESQTALVTGAGWVGLDPEMICTELARSNLPGRSVAEFAADLDIADPEFDDWLRDMRLRTEPAPDPDPAELAAPHVSRQSVAAAPAARDASNFIPDFGPTHGPMQVVLKPPMAIEPAAGISATILTQEAAWRFAELLPAEMVLAGEEPLPPHNRTRPGLLVSTVASQRGNEFSIMITVSHLANGRNLGVRRFSWAAEDEPVRMPQAINQLIIDFLGLSRPLTLANDGFSLWDVFSFDRSTLLTADGRLSHLQDTDPMRAGTYMSMRAFLRITMALEQLVPDQYSTLGEARELTARGRESSPSNAGVFGVSSLVHNLTGNHGAAQEMAQIAQTNDAKDSFTQLAITRVLIQSDRAKDALTSAHALAQTPLASMAPATWLMHRAMAEVSLGKLHQAEDTSAAAHAMAPSNRPSLRFLSVLRLARGDEAGADEAMSSLQKIEPGFQRSRLYDPEYPISTLRAAGLLSR